MNVFRDVPDDHQAAPALHLLNRMGIIAGTPTADGLVVGLHDPVPMWRLAMLLARVIMQDLQIRDRQLVALQQDICESTMALCDGNPNRVIGHGAIIALDGKLTILTAHHVTAATEYLVVKDVEGNATWAKVTKEWPELDLALVESGITSGTQSAIPFAPALPEPGSTCVVVGSPAGVPFKTSVGVISGGLERLRYYTADQDMLPTDAAINPGNSGGVMVDAHGRLVAIVGAKLVAPGYENLGYGVPVTAEMFRA